MAAIFWEL